MGKLGSKDVLHPWAVLAIHTFTRSVWLGVHAVATFKILTAEAPSSATKILYMLLLTVTTVLYIRIQLSPPAYAPSRPLPALDMEASHDHWGKEDQGGSDPPCKICGAAHMPEVKHCMYCNRCVYGWDHHCVFVGQCVGRRNHSRFWWYVLAQVLLVAPAFHAVISSLHGRTWRDEMFWAFAFGFLVVSLIVLGCLLGLHTVLACTLQLTYPFLGSRTARRAARKTGIPMKREKRRKFTVSEMADNFVLFLTSSSRYASRVAALKTQEDPPQHQGRRYARTWKGAVARAVDGLCDNRFWSCC